ncbi:MAG: 50S ribosomal protein L24 [Oscillospiraceae bacterium]|jgi:large subunit ribosomal protein L24|nr:50S ribosomal protein L24 [Oscillospiraceae bacterium]
MHIKKDDKVIVLSGKDKGKMGTVLSADPKNGKVIVEGVNVAKRHLKARKPGEEGGIIKKETPIYTSKVMRVCPKCGRPTREAHKFLKDGTKSRICKKCGETI